MKPFNSLDFWGRLLVGFVFLQFVAGWALLLLVNLFVDVQSLAPLSIDIVAVAIWSASLYVVSGWAKRTAEAV